MPKWVCIEVITLDKQEKSKEKVNLVDRIIDERMELGITTTDREEIDMWSWPRAELEKMLEDLKGKFGAFKQEDLMVSEGRDGKFRVSMLDGIWLDVPPFDTMEQAQAYIKAKFVSKSEVMQ